MVFDYEYCSHDQLWSSSVLTSMSLMCIGIIYIAFWAWIAPELLYKGENYFQKGTILAFGRVWLVSSEKFSILLWRYKQGRRPPVKKELEFSPYHPISTVYFSQEISSDFFTGGKPNSCFKLFSERRANFKSAFYVNISTYSRLK